MKKVFNTTGNCYRHKHYMMDNSAKVAKVFALVEAGHYFSINRPRQYGKTTTLFEVFDVLKQSDEYLPIKLNFQGLDSKWYKSDEAFAEMVVEAILRFLKYEDRALFAWMQEQRPKEADMQSLSDLITDFAYTSSKKLVLLIDEVDASSNYMPFLSFLGMLRTKYLDRESPQHRTFHSIMLVGVHDIKSLKYKLRNPEDAQYNSPWNIAVDFKSDMEFSPEEIAPMLREYSEAEGISMDIEAITDRLFYQTAGYPFLVSRLCQLIAEDILPKTGTKEWTLDDVESAVQLIHFEVNTNFESLIKNLENNPDLYELVQEVLLESQRVPFNPYNPTIHKGIIYGVFKQNGVVKINNRIYEQVIYNYLISVTRNKLRGELPATRFELPDGSLDFVGVLRSFQAYMKEHFNQKDKEFWEKHWRLLFLAFMRPILNGKGYDFKEVQISDENRLDVIVTYGKNRYLIELKRWYGPEAHQRGLAQLSGYMESVGLDTGFLVIFDHRREVVWKEEWVDLGLLDVGSLVGDQQRIFAVWV